MHVGLSLQEIVFDELINRWLEFTVERLYLKKIEALRSSTGVVLDGFIQVLCIFYLAAAEYVTHVYGHFFITPVQLIDVCMVTSFDTFVCVLRPGKKDKIC